MANLITGYRGTEHVTAADVGSYNAATIGSGKYVFNSGQSFKAEIVSNNLVRVYDGDMLNQGRHIRIDTGDYEDAEIATGLVDTYRNDLIVMRYTKDTESQVESANITVIQGVSGDTAVDPTYISDDILNGAEVDDVPLYRVKLEGLSIVKVEALFEVTDSVMALIASLKFDLTNQSKQINELNTNLTKQLDGLSIQAGESWFNTVSGANEFSVTFEKSFSSVPIVVATPRHGTSNSTTIKICTRTTTGFTGNLGVNNNGNTAYGVDWIAIGLM